ncbi:LAME_0A00584g1_1 [Lachancea meyersii CBS 8951]|uniref:Protein FMP52, mitochondrial n=1 Tax=Lachancea meyersii CBS 8951 TaxID=1266667 RepID=A0A1G4ILA8_9SACH|nr:LAME_0A00584g1_1 [Lachancea meyersii CBS 8951]
MACNALVLGATGLCGSALLKYAAANAAFDSVATITRKELQGSQAEKVRSTVEKDSTKWADLIPDDISVIFSALATTKADAGGKEAFYKFDHDFNLELAKSAKNKGCKTFVLVSSIGADVNSSFFYLKTKGDLERDILALNFDKTIFLRPGALLGERVKGKGLFNSMFAKVGGLFYNTRFQAFGGHPVYGDEVGKAGVILALDSSITEKSHIAKANEIVALASKA